jgi:hypothetical protein
MSLTRKLCAATQLQIDKMFEFGVRLCQQYASKGGARKRRREHTYFVQSFTFLQAGALVRVACATCVS